MKDTEIMMKVTTMISRGIMMMMTMNMMSGVCKADPGRTKNSMTKIMKEKITMTMRIMMYKVSTMITAGEVLEIRTKTEVLSRPGEQDRALE